MTATSRRGADSGADRGAAAVLAVSLAVLLLTLTGLVTVLGGLLVASRKASAAADLAALAGAAALQGGQDPCRVASSTVRSNQARIRSCEVSGEDVHVRVTRDVPVLGRTARVPGNARAGPDPAGSGLGPSG